MPEQQQQEIAPPAEKDWAEHLKDLKERDLAQLAKDYAWLDCEARAGDSRQEFHQRREAIIAECERRGLNQLAEPCRPQ